MIWTAKCTTTWTAKIKLPNSALEEVTVQAGNAVNAKALLEQIYGKGSIFCGPSSVGQASLFANDATANL